jgi:hypothetical protein
VVVVGVRESVAMTAARTIAEMTGETAAKTIVGAMTAGVAIVATNNASNEPKFLLPKAL